MAIFKKQKTAEERLAERNRSKLADYKRVFSTEQGKRVLYDMVSSHYVMNSTYVRGDAIDMAFREGQRQVVMRIMTIMKMSEEQVSKTIEESNDHVRKI